MQVDEDGFILTGAEIGATGGWIPLPMETSLPGIFAVGDVRHGSIKRVATAAGEGAMVVRLIHERLASPPAVSLGAGPQPDQVMLQTAE